MSSAPSIREAGLAIRSPSSRHRVAVGRAFAGEPDVLFAGERAGGLDSHAGERRSGLVVEVNKGRGTSLVRVTHEERMAHGCRRRIRLEGGEMVAPLEPGWHACRCCACSV
ncbi:hypothetical protein B1218_38505, partial [Pseudomonas ogarae]